MYNDYHSMLETTEKPKYVQLADHFRQLISTGDLKVGQRLPSYAEMYRQFGVATATAQGVFQLLEQEGLIERRPGSGIYVSEPKRNRTGNIGYVGGIGYQTPKVPFHQLLMEGMQQAVGHQRQHLLYLGRDGDWEASSCDKIDGLILCNIENAQPILESLPDGLPVVSVLTIVEGITSVGVDDYRGSQLAVRYLLDHGHRRIACLMEESPSESRRRYSGYRDALLAAGITAEPGWSRLTPSINGEAPVPPLQPYREWARQHMQQWMEGGWHDLDCTAILVQNEMAAIGVTQVLQEQGLRVPTDISVLCFDGTEVCDLVTPSLTAISMPLAEIGARAVEILSRQIKGETSPPEAVMLPLTLQPRQSVASARLSLPHASDVKVLIKPQ